MTINRHIIKEVLKDCNYPGSLNFASDLINRALTRKIEQRNPTEKLICKRFDAMLRRYERRHEVAIRQWNLKLKSAGAMRKSGTR